MRILKLAPLICLLVSAELFAQDAWRKSGEFRGPLAASAIAVNDAGDVFAGGLDGCVYFSKSKGRDWEIISDHFMHRGAIQSILIAASGDVIIETDRDARAVSSDGGRQWTIAPRRETLTRTGLQKNTKTPGVRGFGKIAASELESIIEKFSMHRQAGVLFSVAKHPQKSETLLAGARDGHIFISTDNGDSWRKALKVASARGILGFAFNAEGDVFAASDAGVYVLLNHENTWVEAGLVNAQVRAFSVAHNGWLFAGTFGAGLYRSKDEGDSWEQLSPNFLPSNILSLAPGAKKGEMFAGTVFGGLYYSNDNGDSWAERAFPERTIGVINMNDKSQLLIGLNTFLGFGSAEFTFSEDYGLTWNTVEARPTNVRSIISHPNGHTYVGGALGVYRTIDADLKKPGNRLVPYWWREPVDSTGYVAPYYFPRQELAPHYDIWSIVLDDSLNVYAAGWGGEGNLGGVMYKLSDTTWTHPRTGMIDSIGLALARPSDGNIYLGTLDGSIMRSGDGGALWTKVNEGMTDKPITRLFASISGPLYAATRGDGVFKNVSLLPLAPKPAAPVLSDSVVTENITLRWRGGGGITYHLQAATDSAFESLLIDESGLIADSFHVENLINEIDYFWRVNATNNLGTGAWSIPRHFFTNIPPRIPIQLEPEDEAVAVGETAVFRWNASQRAASYRLQYSVDSTFQDGVFVSGLTDTSYTGRALQRNARYFWRVNAANNGGTTNWSSTFSFLTGTTVAVEQTDASTPASFGLHQNYPNPFNPATNIRFELSERANVLLQIYDALGKSVFTLVDEKLAAGLYNVNWNAAAQASGVFYYRITASRPTENAIIFTQTRKMVLIR